MSASARSVADVVPRRGGRRGNGCGNASGIEQVGRHRTRLSPVDRPATGDAMASIWQLQAGCAPEVGIPDFGIAQICPIQFRIEQSGPI